ncbi:ribulose bisphosphate carboxylase small subunit [Paracoccus sp. KCTC 42845]|uniref:Ribulose bisphosphate carboxylase small subunit n=1 Tax=Paracoccus aerius TaxID=1915382 RepID=A0ABS1S0N1_9RHOB|nr:ribulose bisphosphate carboxylase small subunit [Paracoccus aerius]GHG12747.1 hypothetical protein GCM10017322_05550 [Paracoccus aerius]
MKLGQGQFSFLPDLSDDDVRGQAHFASDKGRVVSVERPDDPHPRNTCGNRLFNEATGRPHVPDL